MGAREIRTAAEIEVLSPDERQRIFDEHVVGSIDELPAGFQERVRATGERLLRDRGLLYGVLVSDATIDLIGLELDLS